MHVVIAAASLLNIRDHLGEFTSAVAVVETSAVSGHQRRSATSYVRVLFEALTKMVTVAEGSSEKLEVAEDQLSLIESLPEIYQCFLRQNRYSNRIFLHLTTVICTATESNAALSS